ncbi:EAL domain-containing protein [Delftia sp. PS-11]|uniref:bifunctional diguanylate cyclase/phosphodiesterase n=1 Tax=Delftia sp. PS-11 TaxID=2767222 RepID=UPI0024591009|nr:EAL domain-containing protein [Delftia sp. PS-11]KAJ8746816.1 EAL domain-containing protein [Delftia sp. PS-11]
MAASSPSGLRRTLLLLLAMLLLTLATAVVWLLSGMRTAAQEEASLRLVRFVLSAEAAISRSIESFDGLALGVDELLGARNQAAPLQPQLQEMLRTMVRQNTLVRAASVWDAQGRELASSEPGPGSAFMLPPQWWDQFRQQGAAELSVSPPLLAPASQAADGSERMLYLVRPLRQLEQGGYVLMQLPVSDMGHVLSQGGVLDGLEVTLEGSAGELLVSMPQFGDTASDHLLPPVAQTGQRGVIQAPARLSHVPALVAVHPLPKGSVWITASLPMSAVLAEWRVAAWSLGLAVLVFGVLLSVLVCTVRSYMDRLHSARRQAQRSEQWLDQALDSMVSGFLLLDAEQRVLRWNRCYADMFSWHVPLLEPGRPLAELLQACPSVCGLSMSSDQIEEVQGLHGQLLQLSGKPVEQQLPSGRFVQMTARPAAEGGIVITYNDVTDIRLASAEIESLAFYDPLTSLPNRRLLLDRLAQATVLAAREGWTGALLFLDLDQFKMLNDTLGHEVGDQLLQQVAQRLRSAVRSSDTVARLGGDEFVVMLSELAHDHGEAATLAQRVGEKILARLNQPYVLGAHLHRSACSIGATLFGQLHQSAAELLKQADIAMYQIKARNGSGLCFFDPQMQVEIHQRVRMEGDLRQALAQSQFELHYQPQFTLSGEVIGAEALLRWRHPERGLVPPGMFIAVAEESEIIVPLGMWVIRTACEQLATWQRDGRLRHLQLAVNVSARQFRHQDFASQVIELVQACGIPAHLLKLELTESLVIENVQDSIAKMTQLRSHGVRFSMDDFGTGHSSLTYLTQLPLHQLKIDQSFVRHMGMRHTDDVIVQTIIGMARNLHLDVIAEGVETLEQRAQLSHYGCEYFQGYLFSPPVPIHTFEQLLAKVPVRMPA